MRNLQPRNAAEELVEHDVEHGQDLVARIGARSLDRGGELGAELEVGALDVGADEVVLGREQPVEGGRRDPGLGRDEVDARGADPPQVEQVPGHPQYVGPGLSSGSMHGSPSPSPC
jgi:hypothetical protein